MTVGLVLYQNLTSTRVFLRVTGNFAVKLASGTGAALQNTSSFSYPAVINRYPVAAKGCYDLCQGHWFNSALLGDTVENPVTVTALRSVKRLP